MKGEEENRRSLARRIWRGRQKHGGFAGKDKGGCRRGDDPGPGDEYFRLLVENINDVITVINADGTVRYISPSNERYSGFSHEELEGRNPLQFIHPDDVTTVTESLTRLASTPGGVEETEYRIRSKDGNWRYVHTVGKNMLEHPLIRGIVLTASDLSELKDAKRVLVNREKRYREIVENLNDAVFNLDGQGRFTYVSPAITRISRYAVDEIIGHSFLEFVHPDDMEGLLKSLEATLAGRGEPFEFRVLDRDGTVRHVRTSSRTLFREGDLAGITGLMTDITDRRQAEEEAQRFKAIADNANYGVAIAEISGKLTYVNDYFADAHGYTPAELEGKDLSVFHSAEQLPRVLDLTHQMSGGKDLNAVEVWHTRRDGEAFPMLMNLVVVRDNTGNPCFLATTAVDIMDRKRWEEALRESEERYRDLFENASDLIQSVDPEGRFVYVNRAWLETLGYTPEELADLNYLDIIHPDSMSHCAEMFERVMAGESLAGIEAKFVAKDGMEIVVEGSASCRFEEGKPVSTRGIFRNITERKKAEEELELYRGHLEELVEERTLALMKANERLQEEIAERIRVGEELEEKNIELDAFAHTVSHDLRGSLSLIRGFAQTARSEAGRDEYGGFDECVGHIIEVTQRMEDFVASILAYAGARHSTVDAERVDIAMVLRDVLEENEKNIARLGAEISIQSGLPAIHADRSHAYQVFSNLIGNSLKYMGDCRQPRIEVNCREEGDMAVYCVGDNGAGIEEEEQGYVFEPFRRCGGPSHPGLGIGLSTVKRAVEGWGGEVWLESTPGEGTSFYFTAPLA